MAKDYYAILGVDRDSSPEEIKRAFRRLARETHPDANPGDPTADTRFREVAEAYEVLSDPERRRRYDRGDTIDVEEIFSGFGGLDDLLRSVFGDSGIFTGGFRTTRTPPRGRDVLTRVEIDLTEAAFGTDAEVRYGANASCDECGGSGAGPGSRRVTCSTCRGQGAVRVARRGLLGTMMTVTTCETCGGAGSVITEPCERCGGSGVHASERVVRVEIPAGVTTGTRLRLNREGESAGAAGRPGDLFVEVHVREDPRYERLGDDLVHRVRVGIAEATLGATLDVPLIEGGSEEIEVPPGTQPGSVFRLRGLGMGRLGRRGRGDLLIEVNVEIPTELTEDQAELLRRFAELSGDEEVGEPTGRRRRRGR